jgi:hypothetical protein
VAEDVRRDPLAVERRAATGGGGDVLGQQVLDAVAAQTAAASIGEERVGGPAAALSQPGAQDGRGLMAEGDEAVLSALAVAADARRGGVDG